MSHISGTIIAVVRSMAAKRRNIMEKSKSHPVYAVTPRDNEKPFYQRVGIAFEDDGGFNLLLNALPISGRLRIKTNGENRQDSPGQSSE